MPNWQRYHLICNSPSASLGHSPLHSRDEYSYTYSGNIDQVLNREGKTAHPSITNGEGGAYWAALDNKQDLAKFYASYTQSVMTAPSERLQYIGHQMSSPEETCIFHDDGVTHVIISPRNQAIFNHICDLSICPGRPLVLSFDMIFLHVEGASPYPSREGFMTRLEPCFPHGLSISLGRAS